MTLPDERRSTPASLPAILPDAEPEIIEITVVPTAIADHSFDRFYRVHRDRIAKALAFSLGDVDLAAEATDEAFVRAYERWGRVSQMASPAGWTYRVALNVVRRRQRRQALERRLLRRAAAPDQVPGPTGELWLVVAALPQRQRLAVLLRHVGHLTEPEIADVMGIARGTVSSTLRAAYRSLEVAIDEDEPLFKEIDR